MAGDLRRRYEFGVLVLIVGVLALLLMQALERTRREIEEAAVQSEIAALRVELLDRVAHREVHGGPLPQSDNPVRWAEREPQAYRGELSTRPAENGVWFFDVPQGDLVYRYRAGDEARYRLERVGRAAATDNVPGRLAGVGLRRVVSTARN